MPVAVAPADGGQGQHADRRGPAGHLTRPDNGVTQVTWPAARSTRSPATRRPVTHPATASRTSASGRRPRWDHRPRARPAAVADTATEPRVAAGLAAREPPCLLCSRWASWPCGSAWPRWPRPIPLELAETTHRPRAQASFARRRWRHVDRKLACRCLGIRSASARRFVRRPLSVAAADLDMSLFPTTSACRSKTRAAAPSIRRSWTSSGRHASETTAPRTPGQRAGVSRCGRSILRSRSGAGAWRRRISAPAASPRTAVLSRRRLGRRRPRHASGTRQGGRSWSTNGSIECATETAGSRLVRAPLLAAFRRPQWPWPVTPPAGLKSTPRISRSPSSCSTTSAGTARMSCTFTYAWGASAGRCAAPPGCVPLPGGDRRGSAARAGGLQPNGAPRAGARTCGGARHRPPRAARGRLRTDTQGRPVAGGPPARNAARGAAAKRHRRNAGCAPGGAGGQETGSLLVSRYLLSARRIRRTSPQAALLVTGTPQTNGDRITVGLRPPAMSPPRSSSSGQPTRRSGAWWNGRRCTGRGHRSRPATRSCWPTPVPSTGAHDSSQPAAARWACHARSSTRHSSAPAGW